MLEQIKSNKANKAQHLCSHLLSTTLDMLALSRKLEKLIVRDMPRTGHCFRVAVSLNGEGVGLRNKGLQVRALPGSWLCLRILEQEAQVQDQSETDFRTPLFAYEAEP